MKVVVKGLSDPEIEIMKKKIIKIFKDCGLKIAIKFKPPTNRNTGIAQIQRKKVIRIIV